MLYMELIHVYCENLVKHISILCWQNVKFQKLKLSFKRLTWQIHSVKEVHVTVKFMYKVFLGNSEFDH
jgi:hypothetical protein